MDATSTIGMDAGTGTDAMTGMDATSGTDAIAMACTGEINLNTAGTATTGGLLYSGTDMNAPAAPFLPPPSCQSRLGAEVFFSYTPPATAPYRISTNYGPTT